MSRKILQIMPSRGVFAVFREETGEQSYPLVCWALVEDDDHDGEPLHQWVVGMIIIEGQQFLDEVDGVESGSRFLRYE